jgi:hypothetical protein
MPDVIRLCAYWQQHPPPHVVLAGYLGYKPAQRSSEIGAAASGKLAAWLGAPVSPPQYVRELVAWAEGQRDKLSNRVIE